MAQLGIILLIHSSFERAAQTARLWRDAGCPVVVHIDKATPSRPAKAFQDQFQSDRLIRLCSTLQNRLGRLGLGESKPSCRSAFAAQITRAWAYSTDLSIMPDVAPTRGINRISEKNARTDFIESVWIDKIPWQTGALNKNDFTGFFPSTGKANGVCSKRLWRFKKPVRCAGNHRQICACIWDHNGGA